MNDTDNKPISGEVEPAPSSGLFLPLRHEDKYIRLSIDEYLTAMESQFIQGFNAGMEAAGRKFIQIGDVRGILEDILKELMN